MEGVGPTGKVEASFVVAVLGEAGDAGEGAFSEGPFTRGAGVDDEEEAVAVDVDVTVAADEHGVVAAVALDGAGFTDAENVAELLEGVDVGDEAHGDRFLNRERR